eukprot:jgi/Botrbrau1/306/Bobra.0022s0272.2
MLDWQSCESEQCLGVLIGHCMYWIALTNADVLLQTSLKIASKLLQHVASCTVCLVSSQAQQRHEPRGQNRLLHGDAFSGSMPGCNVGQFFLCAEPVSLCRMLQFHLDSGCSDPVLPAFFLSSCCCFSHLRRPSGGDFLWTCGAILVPHLVRRARIVWHPDMYMPIPWVATTTPEALKVRRLLGDIYFQLFPRLTTMAYGVVAALIYTDTQLLESFKRHRRAAGCALCLMLVNFVWVIMTNKIGGESHPEYLISNKWVLFAGFVGYLGIIQPAAMALAILCLVSDPWKPNKTVARAISWMSDQTYDVYLLHPLVLMGLISLFPPSTWFFSGNASTPPAMAFWAFGALTLALSIFGGYLQRALCAVFAAGLCAVGNQGTRTSKSR